MTPSKTPTPTPQSISALLRKAGFDRSEPWSLGGKGASGRAPGYLVRAYGTGVVRVHHEDGKRLPADEDRQRCAEMAERYAQAIEGAGYAVKRRDVANWSGSLIVTAREGTDD